MILQAAADCAAIITVSSALKDAIVSLGVTASKITVLRNGVDLDLFYPEDRAHVRARLGATRYALASVGNLIPEKGHHLAIEALRHPGLRRTIRLAAHHRWSVGAVSSCFWAWVTYLGMRSACLIH